MTATITNINDALHRVFFSDWSDEALERRMMILARYRDGWDDPSLGKALMPLAFPDGFKPDKHPNDDITAVGAEIARRGEV